MKNLFDDYFNIELDDDFLNQIPDNFGMELNFSGVKEDGIFTMGMHYTDSMGEEFNVEAEGRTAQEILDSLIINFQNVYNEEDDIEEKYEELLDEYNSLKMDYNKLVNAHGQMKSFLQSLADDLDI